MAVPSDDIETDADGFARPPVYINTRPPIVGKLRSEIKRIKPGIVRRMKTVEAVRKKLVKNSEETRLDLQQLIQLMERDPSKEAEYNDQFNKAEAFARKLKYRWENFLVMQKKAEERKSHLEYLEYQYATFKATKFIQVITAGNRNRVDTRPLEESLLL